MMQPEVIDMIFSSKKRRSRRAIRQTAAHFGVTEQECRNEMQAALDEAWATAQQDPEVRSEWEKYFPDGCKPSLEDFMARLAAELR